MNNPHSAYRYQNDVLFHTLVDALVEVLVHTNMIRYDTVDAVLLADQMAFERREIDRMSQWKLKR